MRFFGTPPGVPDISSTGDYVDQIEKLCKAPFGGLLTCANMGFCRLHTRVFALSWF